MSFFETLYLLEMADKRDHSDDRRASIRRMALWDTIFAIALLGLPAAVFFEFRKKKWLMIIILIGMYCANIEGLLFINNHKLFNIASVLLVLFLSNMAVSIEYGIYRFLIWIGEKTGRANRRQS